MIECLNSDEFIGNPSSAALLIVFVSILLVFPLFSLKVLQGLNLTQPTIVACGGGTPCFNNNLAWMNTRGKTIYLKTSLPTILQRVLLEQDKRPLLKKMNTAELQFFIEQKQFRKNSFKIPYSTSTSSTNIKACLFTTVGSNAQAIALTIIFLN